MQLPSNELLSEVLDLKMWRTETLRITLNENIVEWRGMFLGDVGYYSSYDCINIYELAHKCKEWAIHKGIKIESFIGRQWNGKQYVYYDAYVTISEYRTNSTLCDRFHENTEQEAVFKACQWILDNMKDLK